ncbi:hypothetical protein H4I96_05151 [Botrytis cinerea]
MDPITILGAASSAIGIASFGLQLVQILTKYATDAGAAAQNLKATLTNIRAASVSFEYVNHFLKQESERLKLGQKATLNARGIRQIQGITDDCLKVFWRVEAWVLYKDDSNELELKIANRLNEYKEDVKFDPERPSQFLKVDETLAKVRKLRESWLARYLSPLQTHKLLQYARELHELQASLNLLFTVISVRLNGPRSGSASINAIHAVPYDMTSRGIEQVAGMRPEATNYMFHPRMNDYETQHLNHRFINQIGRKHLIPVASGIRYVDNPYTYIPQSFFQNSELNQRENIPFRKVIPPAVPDDPLNSVLRMDAETKGSFLQGQDSKGKTNAGYAMGPGNQTIDAAKSYMAHHDAEARLKPELMNGMGNYETKTYLDHFMPVEKTRDIDNLSTVAQRSTKASMNVEDESSAPKTSKYPPNHKEHERPKTGASAKSWYPKVSTSNNESIVPAQAINAPSVKYQVGCKQANNILKPAMQINDIEVKDKTIDSHNESRNEVPRHAHILQAKQFQPETSHNLEPNISVSESRQKIAGSFNDNSEDLIDFSDNIPTIQQPTAVAIDEMIQARNSSPQAVQYDLLSGDLDELRAGIIGELKNPTIPKTCFYDTPPRATSDDTVETVTAKVLAALAPILSNQTQLHDTIDQPDSKTYEQFAIKKEEIAESLEVANLPVMEKFSDKKKSIESQDKIIPQSRASDASIKTSSSSSTNHRSQQDIEGQSYQQIPTVRNFKLRKSEIERMLSQTPQQDWWKEFCFLESAETASLTQILKPQGNYRKALISLKEVKKHSSRLWSRGEKGHIAIVINKPLAHLDLAPDFGLDFRSAPTRVDMSDNGNGNGNGNAFGPQQLGELISRAIDDRDCLYGAYTIHPILIESSYQSPDWVNAHGVRQHFSGRHILGRILELSTSSGTVITKLLDLTVPQQRQVQKIVDSNNEVNSSITWTLAQLEVVYGKCLSPVSDGILSITVYLVGNSNEPADNTSRSEKSGWTMSSSSTLKDRGADDIQITSSIKSIHFTKSLKSPQTTSPAFLNTATEDTEPIPPNSPIDISDSERTLDDNYEILQIPTNANAAAIKDAHISLRKNSNSKSNPSDPSTRKRFVTAASRAPDKREAYDEEHKLKQPQLKRQTNHPIVNSNPSVKFKRTESWVEDHRERDHATDDEGHHDRRRVGFAESRRMVIPAQMMNFHNELMGWEEYPTEDFLNHWPDTGAEIQHMMMIQDTHYLGDILDQGLRPSKVAHQMKIQDQSHLGEPRSAAITPTIPSSETHNICSSPKFACWKKLRSPERGSLHHYSNQPARSFADRASASNHRPSGSLPRRMASVARPVTDSVNWRQSYEPNHKGPQPNKFSGAYNDWNISRRIQPPSPQPSPRPTSYNLPSQQFIQEPIIPFDRRPAYYPDHYDGKSYDPYGASGTEHTDDNIVQQLLLEWTPAGEEAEAAAAAQNADENNNSTANRSLNDTYNISSRVPSQNHQTAQEQVEKIEIPDATKMNIKSGRRPMATVEDDSGEFSDFERPSLFPRQSLFFLHENKALNVRS